MAKASLVELGLGYEDFLRHRGLQLWSRNDPCRQALVDRHYATANEVAARLVETAKGVRDGRTGSENHAVDELRCVLYLESFANAALVLVRVATML